MLGSFGKGRGTRVSVMQSLPAPVGGWNARDSIANMDETDAVIMDNQFPSESDVMGRKGYTPHVTGMPAATESLLVYTSGSADQMFAASGGKFYNVSATGDASNRLHLPGGALDNASTPDAAVLDITGDIDLICCVALDDWTPPTGLGSGYALIAKWVATGSQASYQLRIAADGYPQIFWSVTGSGALGFFLSAISTVVAPASNGEMLWIRATLDVNNGMGGYTATFYTADYAANTALADITWTVLDTVTTTSGTTSIFSSTSALEIGSANSGVAFLTDGDIYRAQVYQNIGGTLRADFYANDAAAGAPTVVSAATGETYTLGGASAIQGSAVVTGNSNDRWQHTNITTAGGSYLFAVNGVNPPYSYDGTTWANPAITGVNENTFRDVMLHKSRLWFAADGSLTAWYLNTDSIAGTASPLPLSAVCRRGGEIVALGTWTIDAGEGVDDHWVAATSEGEVVVYKGTDPSSASTWALVGVWEIGSPLGQRCMVKFGGDLLINCVDGVMPMSKALISARVNPRVAMTDKIQGAMSTAATNYANNFGWQMLFFPRGDMLLLNVPVQEGSNQQQYVMNVITGSWARFIGIEADCWALFGDEPYFGSATFVGKFWDTFADDSTNIDSEVLQAFSYFKKRGMTKFFKMCRPIFSSTGTPAVLAGLNVDYSTEAPTNTLNFTATSYASWDSGIWDTSVWGGGMSIIRNWQTLGKVGVCAAIHLLMQQQLETHWAATDYIYEPGGFIG